MGIPAVSGWAVVLATLSTMLVGSVWYTPRAFGAYWMDRARVSRDAAASRGVWPIVMTVLVSAVTAWVLAVATGVAAEVLTTSFLVTALLTGTLLWAGFTAARLITHDAFEGRPAGLTAVNVSHELVTVLVMAVIVGLVGAP